VSLLVQVYFWLLLFEDKFDSELPLTKRAPITANHEYFTQLKLDYNETSTLLLGCKQ
jgi:hypothetical protein